MLLAAWARILPLIVRGCGYQVRYSPQAPQVHVQTGYRLSRSERAIKRHRHRLTTSLNAGRPEKNTQCFRRLCLFGECGVGSGSASQSKYVRR